MGGRNPHPTLSQRESASYLPPCSSLSLRVRSLALIAPLLLSACGTPNACLANRYDGSPPQARCVSGLQLPYGVLKDSDPMSGSTAPVEPAL